MILQKDDSVQKVTGKTKQPAVKLLRGPLKDANTK